MPVEVQAISVGDIVERNFRIEVGTRLTPPSYREGPERMKLLSRALEIGASDVIDTDGNFLYEKAGRWLLIFDPADPASPVEVGRLELDGEIADLSVEDPFIYAVTDAGELSVIDISSPQAPVELGSLLLADDSIYESLTVGGGYAYVLGRFKDWAKVTPSWSDVAIVDIGDPHAPSLTSRFLISNTFLPDSVLDGSYLIVSDLYGLWTIDVSDPLVPVARSYLYEDGSYCWNVAFQGDLIYHVGAYFTITDFTNPVHPLPLGRLDFGGGLYSVMVSGDFAYAADDDDGLMAVFDVSDSTAPAFVDLLPIVAWSQDLTLRGDYAYVADMGLGLAAADLSDPAQPTFLDYWETGGLCWYIDVSDGRAYVADAYRGVHIYDVTDPYAPIPLGQVTWLPPDTVQHNSFVTTSLSARENYLYVGVTEDVGFQGIQVYDVSDPVSPLLVSECPIPGACWYMERKDDFLYAAEYGTGLYILDASDPIQISTVGRYQEAGGLSYQGISLSGNLACLPVALSYYPFFQAKVVLLDITDPTNPMKVGEVLPSDGYTPGAGWWAGSWSCALLDGTQLYVSEMSTTFGQPWRLTAYDVSDPASPERVGSLELPAQEIPAMLRAAEGGKLYAVGLPGTLQVYDVSDPTAMERSGYLGWGTYGWDVHAEDGILYLTTSAEGLLILRHLDVELDLVPPHDPIIIDQETGGSFTYTGSLTNHMDAVQHVDVWVDVSLPNGSIYGPVIGPFSLSLGSGVTLSREITQVVPSGIPIGQYSYRAHVGDYDTGEILDEDQFPFEVR
jgi:hypothetical protein